MTELGEILRRNATFHFLVTMHYHYLLLLVLPLLTILGNFLVILAVCKDAVLRTSTNFLLLSLACADLIVAIVVMPFAVYVLVNGLRWDLPSALCYVYLIGDVSASTASIIHMVAISADRFYAVFYHMNYKTQKHRLFVLVSIFLCWVFSVGLSLPAVPGFRFANATCYIESPEFMLYGSVFGFIIPCLLMFTAYGFVFYKLKRRFHMVRKRELSKASSATTCPDSPNGQYIEQMLSRVHGGSDAMRRNTLNWAMPFVAQGLDPEDFLEETDSVSSGDLEELTTILFQMESTTTNSDCPNNMQELISQQYRHGRKAFSKTSFERIARQYDRLSKTFSLKRRKSMHAASEQLRKLKGRAIDVFTRLKTKQGKAIRKETKATKLVVSVLVVFLICWLPFFVLNITKAIYLYLDLPNWPEYGDILFYLFTWLGYFNSGINPLIYSVLNRRFRDAFKRLLGLQKHTPSREEKRKEKSVRLRNLQLKSIELCYAGRGAENGECSMNVAPALPGDDIYL